MTTETTVQRALDHLLAGRLAEAERDLRAVLARQPNEPDALHLLGMIADQTGHHEAAAKLIRSAIAVRPEAAEYHGHLGMVLLHLGRPDDAIEALRTAVRLNPAQAAPYVNLAAALTRQGRYDESIDASRAALPVVTLAGQTPVSRAGISVLSHVGLSDLAAESRDQYVATAVALAADVPRLTELRANSALAPARLPVDGSAPLHAQPRSGLPDHVAALH